MSVKKTHYKSLFLFNISVGSQTETPEDSTLSLVISMAYSTTGLFIVATGG